MEEVLTYPCEAIPERGISKKTAEYFGVRSEFCEEKGKVVAHYFPHTNEAGKICGFKKRNLMVPKKESFSVVGELTKNKAQLFGQDKCQKGSYRLFILEGEYDALITFQTLARHQKYTNSGLPQVASVSFGAVSSYEQVETQKEFIESFKESVCVFDNDSAGIEGAAGLTFIFKEMLHVALSKKDPCEVMEIQGEEALFKELTYNAKKFVPDDVLEEALPFDELFAPSNTIAEITSFPKLNKILKGIRGGETTILLADAGVGKSTIFRHWALDFIDQGKVVDNILLEEGPRMTQLSLICMRYGVPVMNYLEDPTILTDEQKKEGWAWITSNKCKWIRTSKSNNSLDKDQIISRVKWDVVQKVPIILLDHLTMPLYDDNSLGSIDGFVRDLVDAVSGSDSHLFAICHTNRASKKNKHLIKEEDFPFWDKLDKSSGRGSSSIEQLAFNMVVGECLVVDEDWRLTERRLRVVKNRWGGTTGVADNFTLDRRTGKYLMNPTRG